MTPNYINQLADRADPDRLWRLRGLVQKDLPPEKREQLDAGVALRRYAAHVTLLLEVLTRGKSMLITPLSPNGSSVTVVDTPVNRQPPRLWPREAHPGDALGRCFDCMWCGASTCSHTQSKPGGAPSVDQIIYALERQITALQAQADRLHAAGDYSAELPAEDADRLREAIDALRGNVTVT